MADKKKGAGTPEKKPGKFERFWNQLFTYAYDCDNPQTLIINEVFFVVAGIIFGWLCSLTVHLNNKVIVWIALVVMVLGELYFIISFIVGMTTFFLSMIHRKREEKMRERPRNASAAQSAHHASGDRKKKKRQYKISNKRF